MTPTVFENFIIWPHSSSELGYASVYWTIDSLDSVAPPKTPDFLIERITRCTDAQLDGAIILMHVGEPATAEALPRILRALQRRGFQVVTISALVGANLSKTPASQQTRRQRQDLRSKWQGARIAGEP